MTAGSTRVWGPEAIEPRVGVLLVGRGPLAEVSLAHPAVSRRHAELRWADGRLHVCDLGSHSGTRVNGKPIHEQALREGDRIDFGPVRYEYRGGRLRRVDEADGFQLVATGLKVARGNQVLLTNVCLTVQPNQFVGILGPSGSGKTTLLKCLASLLRPVSGSLTIDGVELPAHPDVYRTQLGYVPQENVLYGPLTIRENLDFGLRLRLPDQSDATERARLIGDTLERLQLSKHADKPVALLSGGQRKRVNVAMELLTRPRVLFLDEPTSGLDPSAQWRLMVQLKELTTGGTSVICSTHLMEDLTLFDHVVVIANGTSVYSGAPSTLLSHFGVSSHAALYEKLEGMRQGAVTLAEVARGSPVLDGLELVKTALPPATAEGARIRTGVQVGTLFLRGCLLMRRDALLLALLVGQPVLLGALINLSQQRPDGLEPIFLFAVVTAIWFGLNNTAREVVRDRTIYVRERLAGVTPAGYLLAKIALFGLVGLVQLALLVAVLRYGNLLSAGDAQDLADWPSSYLLLVLWVTYLAAMLLGLLVSTLANTQEAAVAALPLIILPQLLLTGVASGQHDPRDGSFRSLAILVAKAPEASRGLKGWLLEAGSLPTYSRPALALLQRIRPDLSVVPWGVVRVIDWLYVLFLLLATAAALVYTFRRREQRWLEQG